MKKILIRLTIFILPVFVLLGILEYIQRELPHDYKRKRELLEAGLSDWKTLVLGSSHSYLAINPAYLEGPAFNLAYTAQTFTFDLFLLEKYLDQMPQLERIIFPISYPSYGSEAYLFQGIYNKTYYFKHFFGSDAFTKWYEPENYSLTALFTVKRSVDRAMTYYEGKDTLVEFDQYGWYFWEDSMTEKQLIQNGAQTGMYHNQFYDSALYPENIQNLSKMIQMCQENGVELILVSTPMHQSYQQEMKEERYQHMVKTTDSLSRLHKIPYWNFTTDTSYTLHHFMDSNHLNKRGARKFTEELQKLIELREASDF
ncbi:MAG: DUF1574 family protein [Bacteroidota bacterium]